MKPYLNIDKIIGSVNPLGEYNDGGIPQVAATHSELTTILNIAIGIIAAVSVLFIMIGGLRYILSDGDPQKASKAKNTIIYAAVGLIIAISAEAIVAFALNNVNGNT
jgi:uncharacterized membrane protein YidH (DUF202 family)